MYKNWKDAEIPGVLDKWMCCKAKVSWNKVIYMHRCIYKTYLNPNFVKVNIIEIPKLNTLITFSKAFNLTYDLLCYNVKSKDFSTKFYTNHSIWLEIDLFRVIYLLPLELLFWKCLKFNQLLYKDHCSFPYYSFYSFIFLFRNLHSTIHRI